MASNLRVDTILPSTGTTLGIGTASGTINFLGNSNITTTGSINAASATITGNLGVGGVLTYEDVTNIDAIGIITARTGIKIGPSAGVAATIFSDGSINTSGIVTAINVSAASSVTAATFHGSGANLTSLPAATTDNLTLQAYGSFDLTSGATSFSVGDQMGPFDTIGTLVGITKGTGNSVANSRFTLPSAGIYSIQAKMYQAGNTNPAHFGFRILQNGTIISHFYEDTAGFQGSNGDYIHFNHYIGEFSANDYVELQAAGNLSSWNADQYYNRLTIYKIGTL